MISKTVNRALVCRQLWLTMKAKDAEMYVAKAESTVESLPRPSSAAIGTREGGMSSFLLLDASRQVLLAAPPSLLHTGPNILLTGLGQCLESLYWLNSQG